MNNKIFKKLIIFCILILVITIIITINVYMNSGNYKKVEKTPPGENFVQTYGNGQDGKIEYRSYYDIKVYMQKYLNALNIKDIQYGYYDKNGDYIAKSNENQIKQKIYNLLSNKYIKENGVTIENIYNYIKVIEKKTIFVPMEIALIQDGDIKSFLVYGLVEAQENYEVIDKIFAIINIDITEGNYSIEPIDGDYNSINEIKIDKLEDTIISNNDNVFTENYISATEIPGEYINIYKELAIGAPEKLYDLLDEEYKNKKFGNLNEFKNYIQKNKTDIITTKLDKYQVKVKDYSKVRYVCIDNRGNYYIINQNKIFTDYTMMLDIYTVDIDEFIEKYDNSQNHEKLILNVQKLKKAIESNDYKYLYNKLNQEFKDTNFKTQKDFEKYLKENYDEENALEYVTYNEVSGVHVYSIKLTNKKQNKITEGKIVMKLKENRDFEFSFSTEK